MKVSVKVKVPYPSDLFPSLEVPYGVRAYLLRTDRKSLVALSYT